MNKECWYYVSVGLDESLIGPGQRSADCSVVEEEGVVVDVLEHGLLDDVAVVGLDEGLAVVGEEDAVGVDDGVEGDDVADGEEPREEVRRPVEVQGDVVQDPVAQLVLIALNLSKVRVILIVLLKSLF